MLSIRNKLNFDYLYFYTTITLAFLIPLAKGIISSFTILLALIWLIEGDYKRKLHEVISSKLLLAFLAFLAFSFLSILWSDNLHTAFNVAKKDIFWLIIFILATSLKKEHIQPVIMAFIAGMLVSEIIAYGVFLELWTFKQATPQNPAPFMNHIDYSVYMAFSAILLLNRIFSNHYSNREKIIFTILFLTVIGNLFLTKGRTGQLALLISIVVMSIIHFKLSFKALALSIFLIFALFTSAYNLSNSFKERTNAAYDNIQKISNLDFHSPFGLRAAYWITTYNIVKENPVIGVGLGDYIDETKKEIELNDYPYFDDYVKTFLSEHNPHNQYLLVTLQMGVIGLFLLFYLFYRMLKQEIDDPEIKELSILFVTIFLTASLTDPPLLKQFQLSLFILFTGLFSIYSIQKKGTTRKHPVKPIL
jgi:O-antigen ligase